MRSVTANISAQNTWTNAFELRGHFGLSISGTWAGTVTVQRSVDGGSTWRDVDSFTTNIETYGFDPIKCKYRVGIKTGGYTSGTAVVELYEEYESGRDIHLA
jgi:hypothetical protein